MTSWQSKHVTKPTNSSIFCLPLQVKPCMCPGNVKTTQTLQGATRSKGPRCNKIRANQHCLLNNGIDSTLAGPATFVQAATDVPVCPFSRHEFVATLRPDCHAIATGDHSGGEERIQRHKPHLNHRLAGGASNCAPFDLFPRQRERDGCQSFSRQRACTQPPCPCRARILQTHILEVFLRKSARVRGTRQVPAQYASALRARARIDVPVQFQRFRGLTSPISLTHHSDPRRLNRFRTTTGPHASRDR